MPTRQMQPDGAQRHPEGDAEVLQAEGDRSDRPQHGGDHEEAPLRRARRGQLQLLPQEAHVAEERHHLQVREELLHYLHSSHLLEMYYMCLFRA